MRGPYSSPFVKSRSASTDVKAKQKRNVLVVGHPVDGQEAESGAPSAVGKPFLLRRSGGRWGSRTRVGLTVATCWEQCHQDRPALPYAKSRARPNTRRSSVAQREREQAIAGRHRDVLLAVDLVGHGPGRGFAAHCEFPEQRTRSGVQHVEVAFAAPREQQVGGGRQDAARVHVV